MEIGIGNFFVMLENFRFIDILPIYSALLKINFFQSLFATPVFDFLFQLFNAAFCEFTNLNKKLIIPSKNSLHIVEERQLAFSDKQVKIEWDKNKNGWVLSNPSEFEKELGSAIYYSIKNSMMIAITNTPSIDEHKKKKYTLSITAYYNGFVTTYIDNKKFTKHELENYFDIQIVK